MNEMIERVATAIYEALYDGDCPDGSNDQAFYLARAAIAAMREPTGAMVEAGHVNSPIDFGSGYRAAIDAALKEG